MKRERIIKIGVLAVVFVFSIIGFSFLTNRGNSHMTADMGTATFPTISFQVGDHEVNTLVGYKREMKVAAVRDTILAYEDNGKLNVHLEPYGKHIDSLKYEILSLDGKEKLREETVDDVKKSLTLRVDRALNREQEGILKITLNCEGENLYYYTRIIKDNGYHVNECVEYVQEFHMNAIKKQNEESIKLVLEPNEKGNNKTLQHVNIHSDLKHVMWGDLSPKLVNDASIEIKEVKKAYTSILLSYRVACKGDNNKEEVYQVDEFFKVFYGKNRFYVLEYDRTMEEVFDTSNVVLSDKGVVLGISDEENSYKINKDGTAIAFMQANELWSYSKEKDAFSLLFSFVDSENENKRNRTDNHSIRISAIDEEGNVTFTVCGYMNRGVHEGESGVGIYYYNASQNTVQEEAFIPSTDSLSVIEKELDKLTYYNKEKKELYLIADGNLLKSKSKKTGYTVVMEDLESKNYVVSPNGNMIAYQVEREKDSVIEIWDLSKDSKWNVEPESGQNVFPLGFVENDFVYGIALEDNEGISASGMKVQAMHRLEIRDQNQKVVKVYEKQDSYILDATIEENQIRLKQGRKSGDRYIEIEEDYITNNETANEFVSRQSYWTDLKQTQYRFVFSKGIKGKKAKTLKAKQVLQERSVVFETQENNGSYYYVYGHGKNIDAFREPSDAIVLAESCSGVVVSQNQHYVWEANNREAWYRNAKIERFTAKQGENGLAACVRRILTYERKEAGELSSLDIKNAEKILSQQLETETIRFHGASVKDVFYLINKGVPVIAMKNSSNAILLVGYDAKTVTYVDPMSGEVFTHAIEKVDQLLEGSGCTMIAYIK